MQKRTLLLVLLIFILATSFSLSKDKRQASQAQVKSNTSMAAEPNWTGLIETQTELEVLYALANCNDQKKLLLKYFNEMPMNQQIKYKISLKYTGYFLEEEKLKAVSPNQVIAADCATTDTSMFVLLPSNWDLDRITVTATVIEVKQP